MSPTKYHQESDHVTKGGMMIAGAGHRLSINKDSHMIQKSPSPPPSSINETSSGQSKLQPVIIYTQTPKVIHVHARDFMSLVQRLTGMSNSDAEKPAAKAEVEAAAAKEEENLFSGGHDLKDCGVMKNINNNVGLINIGENEGSNSGLMNENSYSQFLATTNSNDIFCSSRFNSFFQSPSSFLDFNM